jgi:hypothetical protein
MAAIVRDKCTETDPGLLTDVRYAMQPASRPARACQPCSLPAGPRVLTWAAVAPAKHRGVDIGRPLDQLPDRFITTITNFDDCQFVTLSRNLHAKGHSHGICIGSLETLETLQ